jgi:hypothetical protein
MSKKLDVPQTGKLGNVVNVMTRYGQVERQYVPVANPQAPDQQQLRSNWGRISARWRTLTPEQRTAWHVSARDTRTTSRLGRSVALNGYNYYVRINCTRAAIGLPLLDFPPDLPHFSLNPVGELLITNNGGMITLKLRVPSPPAEHTLVQGAAACSAGVSCVQHFPFLGFLPAPVNGWSDITDLYVGWYGVPPVGKAVFIRTLQHTNGWTDLPKPTSAIVPAP